MRAIAELAQFFDDGGRLNILRLPRHPKTTIGVVETGLSNALHAADAALDIANTGGAINPFDRQIEPVKTRLGIVMDEGGEIDRGGHGRPFLLVQDDTVFGQKHTLAILAERDNHVPLAGR